MNKDPYHNPHSIHAAYDELRAARSSELLYIANVLKVMSKSSLSDLRDELKGLREWLANRQACFSITSTGGA